MPCGIVLTTAIWKRSEQMMLASTGRTVLFQTLILVITIMRRRTAKRVDRGVEENDEVFSDVDFPINSGTGAAAHPELAAVLDKIQALWTTGCGCAMNDYLQFGDGQLASLFSSLSRLSKADKKNSSFV